MEFDDYEGEIAALPTLFSPLAGRVSSVYGDERPRRKHQGIDIAAKAGTPLLAPGNMMFVQGKQGGTNLRSNDFWSHFKDVDSGLEYRFAHHDDVSDLQPGQVFKRGEQWGSVGSAVDRPHLHMAVYDPTQGKYIEIDRQAGLKRGQQVAANAPLSPAFEQLGPKVAMQFEEAPGYNTGKPLQFDEYNPNAPMQFDEVSQTTQPQTEQTGQEDAEPNPLLAVPEAGIVNADLSDFPPKITEPYVRPLLELGGAEVGAALGAGGGLLTGPAAVAAAPAGAVMGGTLGYGLGKKASDWLYDKDKSQTLVDSATQTAKDLRTGYMIAMGGPTASKFLERGVKTAGDVIGGSWARLSKVATDAVKNAVDAAKRGSVALDKGLYSKVTGRDMADIAIANLDNYKQSVSAEYKAGLDEIVDSVGNKIIDLPANGKSLYQRTVDILSSRKPGEGYVPLKPDGSLDWNISSFGTKASENTGVAQKALEVISEYETKPRTFLNMDNLKKHLDGLWRQATDDTTKGFISKVSREVRSDLTESVPGYKDLLSKYKTSEDMIESYHKLLVPNVGRGTDKLWVANNTLVKLMSAMDKDDAVIKRNMIKMLGGDELYDMLTGASFTTLMPKAGPSTYMIGEAAMGIRPEFIPIMAGASPKLQGQFLRAWGKLLNQVSGSSDAVGKVSTYYTSKSLLDDNKE